MGNDYEKFFTRRIKHQLLLKALIIFLFTVFISFSLHNFSQNSGTQTNIQKINNPISPSPKDILPAATTISTPSARPKVSTKSATISEKPPNRALPSKSTYAIALFGDSMVDTMGEDLDYLDRSLHNLYPKTNFKFYNYGIGSQNVVEGLARFHQPFSYKTRNFPPIDKISADIIIISSFAYNPLSPYDKNAHWQNLKSLIQEAKKTGAMVYLLAEIAPVRNNFGKGPGGISWTDEMIKIQVKHILEQLENAVGLSNMIKVPLINAFEKSQVDGKYGNETLVGTHDHIHPSIEGEIFMAELIAQEIILP